MAKTPTTPSAPIPPRGWRAILGAGLLAVSTGLPAGESLGESRSLTVEATLTDLARANEAAIARSEVRSAPGSDPMGNPRVDLLVEPAQDSAAATADSVQSSLHRLKRQATQRQSGDARRAPIEDSRSR